MTTATSEALSDADRYLKEVAPHLAALPPDERADLLDDLALHLREVAAEPGPPLEERLGPPAAYAAELLATAGYSLPVRTKGGFLAALVARVARLRKSAVGREVVRLWPSLRPAWWVARAWLAVYLVTDLSLDGPYHGIPFPPLFGNEFVGLMALLVAISVSIRLGQKELAGTSRVAVAVANGVLLFYALALASQIGTREFRSVEYVGPTRALITDACLRNGDGSIITNLYGYDPEGRLLDPVLLYDQYGRPVDNLCPEFDDQGRRLITEYRRDANGAPVINAFPRRQGASLDPFAARRPGVAGQPEPTVPATPPAP
ncbi:MAG: HAAS signaling domain-containing protein [Acidimicrobiales bacterium]